MTRFQGKTRSLSLRRLATIRDIDLTASESRLDGEFIQGDQRVRVRLNKPQSND